MPKVVIIGGGVAGLSAAHELVYRGFEVEVYEKKPDYLGGKARSINYTHNGKYSKPLPGEHGFRFFPGFYKHVTATMQEIPVVENGKAKTVFDNLVATSRIMIARYGMPPIITPSSFPRKIADIELLIKDLTGGVNSGLTKEEIHFFAERVWQLATTCAARRNNDYERISWWDFTQADRFSDSYKHLLVEGLTRTLVAARADLASTKTGGDIFLQLLYCNTDPSVNTDRVLNGPTNEKWLIPWANHLKAKGVKLFQNHAVEAITYREEQKKIDSITVVSNAQKQQVIGDYFVLAVPVEQAAPLLNKEILAADPTLISVATMAESVAWMNGIQFFLNVDVPINKGHIICSDSEWAITCISQIQFWENYDITKMGNGDIKGVVSVDISDWATPGRFTTRKIAADCTRDEVEKEVWEQLKNSLNTEGVILADNMKVDSYLDRDIEERPSSAIQDKELKDTEPLLVNRINSWDLRPDAVSIIPNLFFASDYVRTNTDLATMEGANEAARRAVNGILDASGSNTVKCSIYKLNEPFCFIPMKWYDQYRFNQGLPWTIKSPLWLKLITALLGVLYMLSGFIKSVYRRIGLKDEASFIVTTMLLTIGFAGIDAWLDWGDGSATILAFGMFGWMVYYTYKTADSFLQRLLLFGIAAGFTELIADNWLVNTIQSLVYPMHEAKIVASPLYMPFAWAVVLIQIGYIGYLYSFKKSLLRSFLFTFCIGMLFIPAFECLAKYAHWWHYTNPTNVFMNTPYYIILGEGLICFALPFIYRAQLKTTARAALLYGVIFGLWIFAAYYIAYQLVG
jgi:uncharacterized protein with NAD-binding domain and iron-sulfur cluster